MPVSYSGIIEEHLAVRNSAGIFASEGHMGEFEISRAARTGDNRAGVHQFRARTSKAVRSTRLCAGRTSGTIDDLIVYRLGSVMEPDS